MLSSEIQNGGCGAARMRTF